MLSFYRNPARRSPLSLASSAATEPSPPWRVNATQLDHHSIRVTWRAPKHLNGRLLNYRLSLTPPEPPQMFITRHTNFTVVLDFQPGVAYTFFVSAGGQGRGRGCHGDEGGIGREGEKI